MKRVASRQRKSSVRAATTLAQQVVDWPRPFALKEAKARVTLWLAEIGRKPPGKSLKRLIAASPKVEALLAGKPVAVR